MLKVKSKDEKEKLYKEELTDIAMVENALFKNIVDIVALTESGKKNQKTMSELEENMKKFKEYIENFEFIHVECRRGENGKQN